MANTVLLPKQGNSVESCIIIEWKKKKGDPVTSGEPICEVETDKATMEVESTADGVILALLVGEGDDVPVMAPIAIVGEAGENIDDLAGSATAPESGPAEPATREPQEQPAEPANPAESTAQEPQERSSDSSRSEASEPSRKIAISPRARKLASKRGVDFSNLTGSGPGGRIMVRDIESVSSQAASGSAPAAATGSGAGEAGQIEEIKVGGIRKIIADRMRQSLATTAQFTMNAGADARALLEYRAALKTSGREDLESISINDLVMFVTSRVLSRASNLNATYSDGVIRRFDDVNLGFAVDTERGLMVPVVHRANRLTLSQLAAESHRLAEAAKNMKLRPEEMTGGTFSVTNLGVYGIQSFTPVLDPPQVAILGVGSIEPKPAVVDGQTEFIPTLGLSLTIDHQIVDGAPGARFLKELCAAVKSIHLTLAE